MSGFERDRGGRRAVDRPGPVRRASWSVRRLVSNPGSILRHPGRQLQIEVVAVLIGVDAAMTTQKKATTESGIRAHGQRRKRCRRLRGSGPGFDNVANLFDQGG